MNGIPSPRRVSRRHARGRLLLDIATTLDDGEIIDEDASDADTAVYFDELSKIRDELERRGRRLLAPPKRRR